MGEAFSDKEVAFSLCCVIRRRGEDWSFIKLPEWLNAIVEHSESAHHHSVTGRKKGRRPGSRKQGKKNRNEIGGGINIEKEMAVENSKIHFPTHLHDWIKFWDNKKTKKRERFFPVLVCHPSLHSTDVWAVVNIPSPPLPDRVKGIRCSPGQRRPHFYMWTAVNTAEWHTTKVGCAAALSLLNGTLAFSFARVSGTHTSQVFAPKMCKSVCAHINTEDFYQFPETGNKEENECVWEREREREDDKTGRSKRADSHAHYISQKDNLHFESILC